ncbi:MAG: tRNA 2-thiouridine(34) synthase MnmA [Bacteroidetes bacterium]|nr:tRNA 2-thiouridine(34) synthase MnmA [Bacteroidota bacterium]MDA0938553.1 tRNA 2-thiouridine(34) synthase MnmA [Bacteroidota bacterium]MDA1345501.1 tRNA 2-thiouridine(34) synthase MnmA [Bacteroidota bacterium]
MKKKRVVVGLSGGVDSSVAAYLLQQEGYEVIGLFMKNWHDTSVTISAECPWLDDSNDAMLVAQKLGIAFQTVDLSEQYKEKIVDYMFAEYAAGRTPNPDVLCNREIKFSVFLDIALSLGADFVATGHYCQKETVVNSQTTTYRLLSGADPNKDQSYFLCQLTQAQLSRTLFPIGHLQKSEVRNIAAQQKLITAEKKDSQGLCFIGKVRLPDFLKQQLAPKKGDIVQIESDHPLYSQGLQTANTDQALTQFWATPKSYKPTYGKVVGKHDGAHYFTIGQRKGLAVGGTVEPLFVLSTDTQNNIIYVGEGANHPGLFRKALRVAKKDIHWVREDLNLKEGATMQIDARIRYRQPLEKATLHHTVDGLYVVFERPQSAITPGQFVAWYRKNELLGSGVIA